MNLHPRPAYLKYLPMPAVVSMDGGYMVMLKADATFVQVVGGDRAVIEILWMNSRSSTGGTS